MTFLQNFFALTGFILFVVLFILQIKFIKKYGELLRLKILAFKGAGYNPDPFVNIQTPISASIFNIHNQGIYITFLYKFFKKPNNKQLKNQIPIQALQSVKLWGYFLFASIGCGVIAVVFMWLAGN